MRSERQATRLNAFTDAAFAFALTLLIVAGGEEASDLAAISDILLQIPGYLFAFAVIATFWSAHVRWSRRDGAVTSATIILTLALIFLVLIFVYPLRSLSQMAFELMRGDYSAITDFTMADAQRLFIFYGLGFAGMSALVAMLHETTRRAGRCDPDEHQPLIDDIAVWSLIALSGVISAFVALFGSFAPVAPFMYWLIPVFIIGYYQVKRRRRKAAGMKPDQAEPDPSID